MNLAEVAILIAGTGALMIITWRVSLSASRYHGIYRFFSFETILLLTLLNWSFWFVNPFSLLQAISWSMLVLSLVPVVSGLAALRRQGKAEGQFENTQALVTSGIYQYIRHPMYLSLMLLGTGICFKNPTWYTTALGVLNIFALVATGLQEEKEMLMKFGSDYTKYMSETKMFIPYLV